MNLQHRVLRKGLFLFVLISLSGYGQAYSRKTIQSKSVIPLSSPRINALQNQLRKGDRSALTQFWEDVQNVGTPLIDPIPGDKKNALVTLLWKGTEGTRNVVIFLQTGGLNPADNQMTRLPDSDVWYRSYIFRNDVRFLYSLSPNDDLTPLSTPNLDFQKRFANVQTDPLNRKRYPPTAGPNERFAQSVVELPNAPSQPWVVRVAGAPNGKVEEQTFQSAILKNKRRVWIYTPANYQAKAKPYPLLILFDGDSYLNLVPTPTILDNLIASGKVPPLVAILINNASPADRERELSCSKPFADSLVKELLPWIREKYQVTNDPTKTVIAGSSLGGLAAACAGIQYPETFGKILSQSGSFYWRPDGDSEYEWVRRQFSSSPKLPLHLFLTVGLFETIPKPGNTNQLEVNRRLHDALKAKGYEVGYSEFDGAHEYINWQGTLADGLIALLGKQAH
jgi:enterochelin esterase-like enzyme